MQKQDKYLRQLDGKYVIAMTTLQKSLKIPWHKGTDTCSYWCVYMYVYMYTHANTYVFPDRENIRNHREHQGFWRVYVEYHAIIY